MTCARPAVTFSAAARMFANRAVPAPVLVIVRPVAVTVPVSASVLEAAETLTVVSSFSVMGASIVWLPTTTSIYAAEPGSASIVIAPGPAIV